MDTSTTTAPDRLAPEGGPAEKPSRDALVGNGLVLAGTILYLCEFAGIIPSGAAHIPEYPGTAAHTVLADYSGQAGGLGFLVGWFALVQLGRVVLVVGLREALLRSGRRSALLDVAVVAMAVGVVLEVAGEALAAGAGALTRHTDAVLALDRGAWYLQSAILAPTGLSLLLAVTGMWRSGLFSRWLCGFGAVVGLGVLAAGLLTAPGQADLQDTLTTFVLLFWVWALWVGVVVLRHRPRAEHA
jgi:hypothetical protein